MECRATPLQALARLSGRPTSSDLRAACPSAPPRRGPRSRTAPISNRPESARFRGGARGSRYERACGANEVQDKSPSSSRPAAKRQRRQSNRGGPPVPERSADALGVEAIDLSHRLAVRGGVGRQAGQSRTGLDPLQFAKTGAEAGQFAAAELRASDEADARRVHRLAVAVHLVVQVRAGRQAGRADIADHLSAPHPRAVRYCDPAHVRVAGGKPPSMREPHVIAMPAVASGKLHRAVADSIDRGAVAGLEIEARVHAPIAENRVPAHPVAGGDTARNRSHQALALLGDAGGFVELAILAPAEHLLARLPVAQDCGIDELAGLDLTGRRALVFNHQVELVGAGNPPVEVDFAAERAQVLLHGAGG